jgi:hypothetical protein
MNNWLLTKLCKSQISKHKYYRKNVKKEYEKKVQISFYNRCNYLNVGLRVQILLYK